MSARSEPDLGGSGSGGGDGLGGTGAGCGGGPDGPGPGGLGPGGVGPPVGWRRRRRYTAGLLLGLAGLIDILAGISAVPDRYVDISDEGLHHLDLTGWGWLRILVGALAVVVGLAVAIDRRITTALAVGVAVAGIVVGVLLLPYHPLGAPLSAGLAVAAIWLLLRPGPAGR
ncbi:hypothetical protein [Plantactinospora sp. GCM10030261]|uniref:DUF7144 family membrane protein n=1 Tax=Plantactinospora sp. GCM10030261 TaxID=3273420 RepID=UPI0036125A49